MNLREPIVSDERASSIADEVNTSGGGGAGTAPASVADRISSLDFIRGVAVMGILAANILAFGQPFAAYMMPSAFLIDPGPGSDWMWIAQFIVVDGKMRGLFTLLFGAGMYLFMERAWARGSTRWLQAKRLLLLLMFGLIHFFFIWKGDILSGYAMCGLFALLFLRMTAKNQLILGIVGYFFGTLLLMGLFGSMALVADGGIAADPGATAFSQGLEEAKIDDLADNAAETQMKVEGSYGKWVGHNFASHAAQPFFGVMMFGWETVPLMLIGMALYRFGLFSGGFNPRKQRLWGLVGLILGGLATLGIGLAAKADGYTYYGTLASFIGYTMLPRLAMTLGLAALLSLYSPTWVGWLAERVRAAGRAAFTNYLGTSVVLLFVFHGWALGLFGKLNRPELYLVTALVWLVMLAWSKPWLDRYRYGPLEWLWRCLTYGKMFPLKR